MRDSVRRARLPRAAVWATGLAVAVASSATPEARANDLRLSVTDTLLSEYRGDNKNQFDDDDNYGIFLNRLNLVASAGDLTASHRLDFVWFVNAPSDDFVDDIRPERMQLAYRPGDFVLTAGDFYRQLGSGIVLSLRKVDELGLDVVLRGGEVKYKGDVIEAAVFGGVTNVVNLDTVNHHFIEDKEDAMAGAVVDLTATDFLRVGTYGLFHMPEESISDDETDWSLSAGLTSELQLLDGDLVLSVEGDVQHRVLAGRPELGWATYLQANWTIGDVSLLLETLFIDQFEQKGSTNSALGNRFDYGTAPTMERIDQEVIDQRDVAGGRVRVEGTLMEGDLTLYGNLLVRFNKAFEDSRLRQIHAYAGGIFLWDYGASRVEASAGYRDESQLGRTVKTVGHFEADLHYSFDEDWALHVGSQNEFRTLSDLAYQRGSLFTGVDWSTIGSLTFEFGYDTQNKSATARNYFFAGIVNWHATDRIQLRATAGTQRGGLKCVAGVCRIFPEFVGARLEAVGRF